MARKKKAASKKRSDTVRVMSKKGIVYDKSRKTGKSKKVASHKKLTAKCVKCHKVHAPGAHRFHGKGSYKRTHPGAPYKKKRTAGKRGKKRGKKR